MGISPSVIAILRKVSSKGNLDVEKFKELSPEEQDLINKLFEDGLIDEALNFIDSIDVDKNWEELQATLKQQNAKPVIPLWKKTLKYAAVFIALIGLFFIIQRSTIHNPETKLSDDRIQLVLENGDIQILNEDGSTEIVSNSGQVLGTQKGTELKYNAAAGNKKVVYNQIKIPNGKTFNLTLSDGTHVYLNAGSTLRFPVNFIKGMKREVYLEGEAFFEVSKDKLHPFIVNANAINVKVLGTKFNVSSYAEDKEVSTVLVEGSVSLNNDAKPNEKTMLIPGYKGAWSKTSDKISLEKVDTSLYTNWMKGELVFKNVAFQAIIKKLERTYNVKIINHDEELNHTEINASFNKNIENINSVMNAISSVRGFNYQITEDKSIIITKKSQ
ncbi:FecR family protein [Flavobacterium aquidurense]|uniref:FecR family protein n=1 Tax=Flavobacterium aquidurense TaxID=362413 RepID=UPI000923A6C1|nr:FecR family protein [Flavobacterium aquidurense]SHH65615.1 FecR family protein [Flavobacterium frigidimaris]